ncbi:Uncharacterized protein APZ42_024737 [Daphnia magna]|uniref:Uncharacterized protein n=1 Tax=Daphnia magna TaxID=35525 RepID=A0A164TT68_9CRUS|nr:Uncharacterized protein APZ42_024737 [Daphnia magna]
MLEAFYECIHHHLFPGSSRRRIWGLSMGTPEMSSMNHYKDSIHILFKMKATGGLTVGTAAKISQPKLPLDNLMLVKTIETYLAKKTEMKIRLNIGIYFVKLHYNIQITFDYSDVESEEESVDESVNESGNGSDESGEERNAHPFLENEEGLFLEAETECWPSEPGRLFTVLEQIGALTVLQTTAKPHVDSTVLSRKTPNIKTQQTLSLANGLNTRNSSSDDADAATHNVSRHSASRDQAGLFQ